MTERDIRIKLLGLPARNSEDGRRRLGALFEACFGEPYGTAAIAPFLAAPGSGALIAQCAGGGAAYDAGFAIFRNGADEAELLSIGVVPAARRLGVGRALLDGAVSNAVAAGALAIFLEVGEDNVAARAMYAAAGFVAVARRRDYYRRRNGDRIDAIVMRKSVRKT